MQRVKELEEELARQQGVNRELSEELHQLRGEARQAEELRRILKDLQFELAAAKEADVRMQQKYKDIKVKLKTRETELVVCVSRLAL